MMTVHVEKEPAKSVQAAAVIRKTQAERTNTGRKAQAKSQQNSSRKQQIAQEIAQSSRPDGKVRSEESRVG